MLRLLLQKAFTASTTFLFLLRQMSRLDAAVTSVAARRASRRVGMVSFILYGIGWKAWCGLELMGGMRVSLVRVEEM